LVNSQFEDPVMAKRKDIEATSNEPAAKTESAPEQVQTKSDKSELPIVESPSISPATPEPKIEPIAEVAPAIETVAEAAPASEPAVEAPVTSANRKRLVFTARRRRNALLAASVAIAAALGAVVGAVASGGLSTALPRTDVAGAEERKAMEQSISRLAKEVTTLKANLEAASKNANNQIAKIGERLNRESAEIVGSIAAPQTTTPVPTPRPAQQIAAAETQLPVRPQVVQDWTIRETRDGLIYVQGHGDIYQVVPGAPLPGLGPVESVKRQDGRWMVVTPKGIIVSMRDRRYFGSF
jgi:hypothetical protein